VNSFHKFAEDDDNDTLLFERWQQNALRNCPNPERIGCPSSETLAAFVDRPSRISLEALNDKHIFNCAECTRELMELQRQRESPFAEERSRATLYNWKSVAMAACLVLAMLVVVWRSRPTTSGHSGSSGATEVATLDLSGYGTLRGQAETDHSPRISLPRRRLDVRLLLPYYSPAGRYRITVGRDKDTSHVSASGEGVAVTSGAKTEMHVLLALENLSNGEYYLGVTDEEQDSSSFYRLHVD
jgi:hypothetical protein